MVQKSLADAGIQQGVDNEKIRAAIEKAAQTEARLTRYYDGVLVHSDPDVIALAASWPVTAKLAAMLHYTAVTHPITGNVNPSADMPKSSSSGKNPRFRSLLNR